MEYERTANGIEYSEELAGSSGMAFVLFPSKEHTRKHIRAAVAELRAQRDVVYLKVASEKDWDERYRSEVFRHPFVSHLRWFEIYADINFIHEHRCKNTSVADYITQFVLPFTTETRDYYVRKYGSEILDR